MPLDRIVIATGNPHKVRELRAILEKLGIDALALAALGAYDEPPETGATFEANASIKALYYARQTGMVCLADDSGLEVDALGGAPGVISSHWCTDGREAGMSRDERDRLNNERLLRELDGVAPEGRTARFVCVMALAAPNHTPGGAGFSSTSGAGFHPAGDPLPTPDRCDAGPRPLSPEQRRMREVNRAPYGKLGKRRRRLPHWLRDGGSYFVTFRLREGQLSCAERQCVLDACFHWHGIRSLVHLAVIMPDHVHLLVTPLPRDAGGWYSLADTIGSAKRHSAFEINRLRGAAGALWMDESFDRLLRPGEFEQKWDYIADNPVRAGLVARSRDYAFLVEGDGRIAERGRAAGRMESCPTPRGEMGAMEVIATTRGAFEGRIGMPGEVPRGEGGFGYDPMFLVAPEYARTSAELPPDEKNARSHRAMAARLMAERIAALREA